MTTTSARLLAAAAAAALVVVLGGCSGDPEPTFADPTPTSPSTSSTPDEPTAPELPAAATKDTRAGARAFVGYWWDVADFAQASGQTQPLQEISAPTCQACSGAIDYVKGIYRKDGAVHGGESQVEVTDIEAISAGDDRAYYVRFSNHNSRQRITYPSGNPTVFKASTTTGRFVLHWVDDGWRVDVWEIR